MTWCTVRNLKTSAHTDGQFRLDKFWGAWIPFWWNNCPHQCQPFCQSVMWPRGPLTQKDVRCWWTDMLVHSHVHCLGDVIASDSLFVLISPGWSQLEPHHSSKLLHCCYLIKRSHVFVRQVLMHRQAYKLNTPLFLYIPRNILNKPLNHPSQIPCRKSSGNATKSQRLWSGFQISKMPIQSSIRGMPGVWHQQTQNSSVHDFNVMAEKKK